MVAFNRPGKFQCRDGLPSTMQSLNGIRAYTNDYYNPHYGSHNEILRTNRMTSTNATQIYQGLIITRHHIVDSVSKDEAQDSVSGWEFQARTAPAWIRALENGHTIQPSLFIPKPDGSYTHDWQSGLWQLTNFICADGDHFLGVEKDDKGNEKHPNGIPPWTDKSVLGEKYPELKEDVYAVGESVSSMQTETPHRRYRLIFLFDKPIKSVPHYKQILSTLAEKYPLISVGKRSPAQPVFGNARKDFREFYISDPSVILPLDDFPFIESTESAQNKAQGALKLDRPPQTLDEYLNAHRIENTPGPEQGKYFVDCPYKASHTGAKQGKTDSYVFDDGRWSFHCSHSSCQAGGRSTWQAFKDGHGIKTNGNGHTRTERLSPRGETVTPAPKTDTPPADHFPVMPVDLAIQAPIFPDTEGEHFGGAFSDLYQAYTHSHVMTAPAIMAMGLGAIGHCAGRGVIVKTSEISSECVFLNTYTLLVGRSDLTAKSDTREQLNGILKRVYTEGYFPISDVQSIEGVIRSMETEQTKYQEVNPGDDFYNRKGYPEGSRMYLSLDEIARLFANARRDGTKNLLSAINSFWKCPTEERVARAKGEQIVEYPVLSVWGNITPDQISEYLQGLDMTGGTINRFMPFFVTPKEETIRHPHFAIEHYDQVIKRLQRIAGSRDRRTLIFSTDADDARFDWFTEQREKHLRSDDDRGETRFHTTAVKIAGIFALGDNAPNDDEVQLSHWKDALAVTRYLIDCYNYSFREVGTSKLSKIEHQILEILNANGNEICLSFLTRKTRNVDAKTRLDVLKSLEESGQVLRYSEITSGRDKMMIRRICD